MKLRSNLRATNMIEAVGPFSLNDYAAATGNKIEHPTPLAQFVEYGLWVQRNAVPDLDERRVTQVQRDASEFTLELADGERFSAQRVVVACGIADFAHIPSQFRDLPASAVSHTGQHSDLSVFEGRRVTVVGGGQSAMECAALMAERGAAVEVLVRAADVTYLHRRSPIHYMGPVGKVVYAPTDVGPLWYSRLVATPALFRRLPRATQTQIAYRSIRPACSDFVRVRLGIVRLTLAAEIARASAAGDVRVRLHLSDGTEREVDHLMFGTGYRVDVARYPFLSPTILSDMKIANGYPVLRRGLETSVPGLHIVGAPASWSFGPILRFVSGSWFAGQAVSRAMSGSARRAAGSPAQFQLA